MSRLVGSPKALVMAVTAEEKSLSLSGTLAPLGPWSGRFSVSSTRSTTGILPIEIVKIPRPPLRRQSMPVTEAQVNEALGSVRHPTLRRPLVDLGLVQRIRIDGGRVEVLVAALEDDDPDTAEVVASIREAVSRVPGAGDVAVPVVVLSPD